MPPFDQFTPQIPWSCWAPLGPRRKQERKETGREYKKQWKEVAVSPTMDFLCPLKPRPLEEPRLSVLTSPPAPPGSSQPGAQTHRGEGAKPGHALLQTKAGPVTYKYLQGDGTREHTDKGQILQMFESLDLQREEG